MFLCVGTQSLVLLGNYVRALRALRALRWSAEMKVMGLDAWGLLCRPLGETAALFMSADSCVIIHCQRWRCSHGCGCVHKPKHTAGGSWDRSAHFYDLFLQLHKTSQLRLCDSGCTKETRHARTSTFPLCCRTDPTSGVRVYICAL